MGAKKRTSVALIPEKSNLKKKLNQIHSLKNISIIHHFKDIIPLLNQDKVKVLIMDYSFMNEYLAFLKEQITNINYLNCTVIIASEVPVKLNRQAIDNSNIIGYIEKPFSIEKLEFNIDNALLIHKQKNENMLLKKEAKIFQETIRSLNEIGQSLTKEKKLDVLLENILKKIRMLTHSDAGSIYIFEGNSKLSHEERWAYKTKGTPFEKKLIFKVAQNDSIHFAFDEKKIEISPESMAGYVAIEGIPINVRDAYDIETKEPYGHDTTFDKLTGYITKSMLVLPMINYANDIIGIIALINRKKDFKLKLSQNVNIDGLVLPYTQEIEDVALSVASQATIAIENAELIKNIEDLFEGFVMASVQAIEQRDPTTSGHSERVAKLTLSLAVAVAGSRQGPFKMIDFTQDQLVQIKYASLLHDFGKVGVRENVLVKGKKLYEGELRLIEERFGHFREFLKNQYYQKQLDYMKTHSKSEWDEYLKVQQKRLDHELTELDAQYRFIHYINDPSYPSPNGNDKLIELSNIYFNNYAGDLRPLLDTSEISNLSITYGTLNPEERREIESHVTHTYNFLRKIPWLSNLKNVPEIAHSHHEKLDGSGYPQGIPNTAIPFESKMMTICDIFDALTARDRPYKLAIPLKRALEILHYEVKGGKIDADLVKLFEKQKVYKSIGITDEKESIKS